MCLRAWNLVCHIKVVPWLCVNTECSGECLYREGPNGKRIGKLHNEELHNLYSSPNIITMIRSLRMTWVGHVVHTGGIEMHISFGWEARRERPLGTRKRIRKDNIKTYLRETVLECLDLIYLAGDGAGGGLLSTRWWTFWFHKRRVISWLAECTVCF
jgi:hypothetical protein